MTRLLRSGRTSDSGFVFLRERPGPPIHSKHPYSFADVLAYHNALVMRREDYDVSYRGLEHSLAQCPDWTCIIHFYPGGDPGAPETPHQSRAPSPASTDLFASDDDDADPDDNVRAHSPTVTELGGPAPPTQLHPRYHYPAHAVAYIEQRCDLGQARWQGYFAAKKALEVEEWGVKAASKKHAEAQRISDSASPPRKSRRQRQGRRDDLSEYGVLRADALVLSGFLPHEVAPGGGPRAFVDRNGVVTGLVSGGPSEHYEWMPIMNKVLGHFERLNRNGEWQLGAGETRSRFGLTCGFPHDGPAFIPLSERIATEIATIQKSDAVRAIAAFQTHLMQQFFPNCFAVASSEVKELLELCPELSTPFPESPFTTSEIDFADAPSLSRKNRRAPYYFVEAVTAVGNYNDLEGGELILSEDDASIRFGPGMTGVFPGTTETRFAAVAKGETRYLFRQFFCAGVLRWVAKGGRTDEKFDEEASQEEQQAWEDMRLSRANDTLGLFSLLREIDTM